MSTYVSAETLPRPLDPSRARIEGAIVPDSTNDRAFDSRPVILNVEDHEPARIERTRLLQTRGYLVIEAESAAEAIRVMTRQTVSLALIDMQLPDSDGVELCGTLKRLHENVPVVLISTTAPALDLREAGRAGGAQSFLEEPIDGESLARCIDGALTNPAVDWDSEIEVVTDKAGLIVDATPAGARLLNGTVRGVQRRSLIVYFEQHRETWRTALVRALAGEQISLTGRLRPKDRRPVNVHVKIDRVVADGWAALRWTFQSSETQTAG